MFAQKSVERFFLFFIFRGDRKFLFKHLSAHYSATMKNVMLLIFSLLAIAAARTPNAFVNQACPSLKRAVDIRGGAMGFDESIALKATTFAASSYGEFYKDM